MQEFRRRRCFKSGIVVHCAGIQAQMVLQERDCCTLCRNLGADGASGAGLLYIVQDFRRRRCFRSGIVVVCAGIRAPK
ncbi:hypothetical protein [Paenibacillus wynnii]|uniref:hypothetical protein n=1 Tax=Paenibacillus wynnii TaxID=268407 RepID=UPI0012F85B68|nr:hypothetical protein [Paenibacillus wynnii]